MKIIYGILAVFILAGCNDARKPVIKKIALKPVVKKTPAADTVKRSIIKYNDQQLEAFLDSVGHLPVKPLADKVAFEADSIFKNQLQLDRHISTVDFNKLKHAIHVGKIDIEIARSIFGNIKIDSTYLESGIIPVEFFSFDKNKSEFNEYSICLGDPDSNLNDGLYFLKSNKIISKHSAYNHYGLELKHYKDVDGKTVIYYKMQFDDGSGIWWNNFFFYKYDGDKLIPILNELQNGNMQYGWGYRNLWLESFVQKTRPLTIKMVYYQEMPDTIKADSSRMIIDDSTSVKYTWDAQSKTLQGQYQQSKISKPQILSYYLEDNELLFINSYYKILKRCLSDKIKRKWTLVYLNKVKNYYSRN